MVTACNDQEEALKGYLELCSSGLGSLRCHLLEDLQVGGVTKRNVIMTLLSLLE